MERWRGGKRLVLRPIAEPSAKYPRESICCSTKTECSSCTHHDTSATQSSLWRFFMTLLTVWHDGDNLAQTLRDVSAL
jgi:hypothetical protein